MFRCLLLAPALATGQLQAGLDAFLPIHEEALALIRGREGKGPQIAPAFSANFSDEVMAGVAAGGFIRRDAVKQRSRQNLYFANSMFHPGQHVQTDSLSINNGNYSMNQTVGTGANSICKVVPAPYNDVFAALAAAKHVGNGSVAGEPCEIWAATIVNFKISVNVSACIAADGVPRQFNQSSSIAYKAAKSQAMTFFNVKVGPQPDDAFLPSEACRDRWPTPTCPNVHQEEIMLYRTRSSKEPNELRNRNAGDALGDMAFFCGLGFDESQVVTSWSLTVNASYGQYAYCLFISGKNMCFSGSGKAVGRESALGLGEGALQGQCSNNSDVGSWFSVPEEGECAEGAPVGQDGCTWKARPLRTVSARCILEERGLRASCAKERGHAPLLRSAAIFRAALASPDPAQGGCPDAGNEDILMV